MSQRDLARQANVSEAAINRLERFDRAPRLETVLKIEEALSAAGVEFERRSDGKFELVINESVIDDMAHRIQAGSGVTARGRIDTRGKYTAHQNGDAGKSDS